MAAAEGVGSQLNRQALTEMEATTAQYAARDRFAARAPSVRA